MNILSEFTRPHVVSDLYDVIVSVEHEVRIFEESSRVSFPDNVSSWIFCVLQEEK